MKKRVQHSPPKLLLLGAAALIAGSLALSVGTSRQDDGARAAVAPGDIAASRSIVFALIEDGSLVVRDAQDGSEIAAYAAEGPSFIRGAYRGLTYARRAAHGPVDAPFDLSLRTDGRLMLFDTVTGDLIDVGAFGVDNARAFANLLETEES